MIAYRSLIAAALMAPLVSCMGQAIPAEQHAQSEARLAQRLAGKVAGPPVRCLPRFRSNDMEVIDRDTILFRDGNTDYLQHTQGGCYPYGHSSGYTLVTKSVGGFGLCQGDIAQVVQSSTGTFAGTCAFNAFTPYRQP